MFLAENSSNLALIIALCTLVGVLLITVFVVLVVKLKKKKHPRVKVNEEFISSLVQALGNRNNIQAVSTVNGRIHFEVEDLDCVDLDTLKKLSTAGVFITNSTIKMLFTYDSEAICTAVQSLPRGE
ncbi:MAG: hypothetical protein K2N65_04595 [Anaeroplasmataceae bacterium]|nr:hypothetical protein [Anaeroplasmataceae bacterium]